uniref:SF3 helicase domain-containing protein n=1 Tax=Haptolina brevifila TaxID=156173 RepID=A0A7S2FRZ1_9EUKA|mmetsp:Transcript_18649/g.37818  ORF Transcript_18649/g.37818 Transcript_18649/m.37818 type:complete len:778 (+) Transcript_18649:340-2673(+)|eukprot:CAMPEP_0174754830 /NCGR_PEP_ID=MMETSP1094-20130205/105940_1 /TAXON_ID=156173 /ORGANISM="Chrysochromulina brevifilum, Strain UTEX LB 985" /LENGTH=777 /DNA_ID=CAMNT_0015960713 /DNA_START=336 /DNA_END=2669 /DNA_ORIENTATION=+
MDTAQGAQAIDTQAALDNASDAERANLDQVHAFYASESWLEGKTGVDALTEIDDVEFEIDRLLGEECGALGRVFKQSSEYRSCKDFLSELRARHQALVPAEPAVGVAVPIVRIVSAVANPLGFYADLLPLINDQVVNDARNFKILICGLRGESTKSDDETSWKAAALALYNRHLALNPNVEHHPFDTIWLEWYDRRLDARVIGHYARLSDVAGFLALCRNKLFPNMEFRSSFIEIELRDYYIMAYGDNLMRIQGQSGIGIWYRKRWRWDASSSILAHEVLHAVHTLYHDLLTRHEERKRDLEANEGSEEEKKEIAKLITKTAKSLSAYGNQQNKNVVSLIQNQQIAQSLEVDPFDEERLLFCFTNKVFDFKTSDFKPHFKFDYMLRNCGREWREPTDSQVERIKELMESIQPDEMSLKSLLSVLRSCLTGVRPELFIIFTGGGRNGKGVVVELIQFLLNVYALAGHLCRLTKAFKSGPNTELREMNKKRCIVWSEPEEDAMEYLRLSNVKMLTGNENQNGRGLYNEDSVTRIFGTCILECNAPPAILGDKGEAARERICFLNFPMTFTNDRQKLAANPDTYRPLDETLKSTTFKETHYCALFKLLATSPLLADVPIDKVHITEASRVQAGIYLDNNDFMPSWITENYTKLPRLVSSDAQTFVSIKELYAGFKASDKFENLTKQQKRAYNEAKFREAVMKSNAYKGHYVATSKVRIPGLFNDGYNTKDGLIDIVKNDDDMAADDQVPTLVSSASSSTCTTLADDNSPGSQDPKRHRAA